jgi:membrane associated rhomboid family serine protease
MLFLPYKDDNPTSTFPFVTLSLIALNVLVYVYEVSLGPGIELFTLHNGLIPLEITERSDLPPLGSHPIIFNFITSLFIHGGLLHLIGNMLFLWIFGDNIEDALGHLKFLLFYLFCGVFAGFTHIFFNFDSPFPAIGASGAISGVLGAYLVLFPNAKVRTLFIFFLFIRILRFPAISYIGLWILMQFLFGVLSMGSRHSTGVAWFAHIGGFIAGIFFICLFSTKKQRLNKKRYVYTRY